MKIYKLDLDVDNYESCYIEDTNISEDVFDNCCTATPLDLKNGRIFFFFRGHIKKVTRLGYLFYTELCAVPLSLQPLPSLTN
ncbi:MAG: hypothetical protein K6A89_01250 [Treponema sp.]|nr:hypothetical protein [Treponema sp.]